MLRRSNKSALPRVVMQILQFLEHDLVSRNRLRMKTLLPHLILTFGFVRSTKISQQRQEPLGFFLLE